MITFLYGWVLYFAPPLLLLYWLVYPSLPVMFISHSRKGGAKEFKKRNGFVYRASLIVLFLVILAQPVLVDNAVSIHASSRRILVLLDVSGSMLAPIDEIREGGESKLECGKRLLAEMIDDRIDDQIGLITFASFSRSVVPVTFHHDRLMFKLGRVVADRESESTSLLYPLASAVKRFEQKGDVERIIIMVTDGEDNQRGQYSPIDIAERASELGVKIFTVGIGVGTLAQQSLVDIAEETGGHFYASDNRIDLGKSLRDIDAGIGKSRALENATLVRYELAGSFVILLIIVIGVRCIVQTIVPGREF